ncbi:Crp/Fnr family transcriptional regulator [Atopobacter sp. AH10]|uniref:Crp/Fnr family transcriptional regulator n=1 Tax=Atopobacter sp. AH10 TaxID=2315861 RepID=UPI00131442A2|nr:Crp/Fnr family transcriptional regulator [Atopobacter sp. AH10]
MNRKRSKSSDAYIEEFLNDSLLAKLTPDEKQSLKEHLFFRSYIKGQILFDEGDARSRVYFLCDGLIRLENSDQTASYSYIDYVSPHKFFPYGGLFSDKYYRYSAFALTSIKVIYIPTAFFEELIKGNKDTLVTMYTHLSDVLSYHELRIRNTTTSSASDRVMQALAIWGKDIGVKQEDGSIKIPYKLTVTELGLMSGTTRETAGNVIKSLKEEGHLEYSGKILHFIDPDYFSIYLD